MGLSSPSALAIEEVGVVCAHDHEVIEGDTLSRLSERFLNEKMAYSLIRNATNDKRKADKTYSYILFPNTIRVGWKLCIPPKVIDNYDQHFSP